MHASFVKLVLYGIAIAFILYYYKLSLSVINYFSYIAKNVIIHMTYLKVILLLAVLAWVVAFSAKKKEEVTRVLYVFS